MRLTFPSVLLAGLVRTVYCASSAYCPVPVPARRDVLTTERAQQRRNRVGKDGKRGKTRNMCRCCLSAVLLHTVVDCVPLPSSRRHQRCTSQETTTAGSRFPLPRLPSLPLSSSRTRPNLAHHTRKHRYTVIDMPTPSSMLAGRFHERGKISIDEVEVPALEKGEVRIKVAFAGEHSSLPALPSPQARTLVRSPQADLALPLLPHLRYLRLVSPLPPRRTLPRILLTLATP